MQALTYLIVFQAKQAEILAHASTTLKMNYHGNEGLRSGTHFCITFSPIPDTALLTSPALVFYLENRI